jgi:hypothetical protein
MSRHHRRLDIWPADKFAVHVWHLVASLEDVRDLVEAAKAVASDHIRASLIKKALVELKSFDELVGELQTTVRTSDVADLENEGRLRLDAALTEYQRTLAPRRKLLTHIRNTLAGHRRALPDERQRKRFGTKFRAWGEWEQLLVGLERQCTLLEWVGSINAAISLGNVVIEVCPGQWFSTHEEDAVRLYMPLRPEWVDSKTK